MKVVPALPLLVLAMLVGALAACPNGTGTFTGGTPRDAGPSDPGPDLNAIGSPCVYDPATGTAPTNTCPVGLQCLIVTRDFAFTSNLALDIWEDHFSIYKEDGTDEGYCTLLGPASAPPSCPAGTVPKLFTGGTVACLRTCTAESQCGRPDYTCDMRYLDLVDAEGPHASCVRRCGLDVPDCVRTGIIQNPNAPQELIPVLAQEDVTGQATCLPDPGVCAVINERTGGSGPGEPCTTSDDCDPGAACYQGALLTAVAGAPAQGPGFCASPCFPDLGADACTTGYACQAAGDLTLGFPEMLLVNTQNGAVSQAGGFCFFTCEAGVAGNCASVPGSECGQLDEELLGVQWNGASMCLPDAVRR